MANLTVTLPADLEAWVETQAQTTEFPSADAYLASLIRHDQERRQALAEVQALVTEGMESGEAKPHNQSEFLARMREKHVRNG